LIYSVLLIVAWVGVRWESQPPPPVAIQILANDRVKLAGEFIDPKDVAARLEALPDRRKRGGVVILVSPRANAQLLIDTVNAINSTSVRPMEVRTDEQ